MYIKKHFKDLTLADDFMFSEIMRQEKFCKPFLEALLGKKITKIVVLDKQKDLTDNYDSHGIRLDIYVEDSENTIYNVEMQTTTQKALEKRVRYYQGGLDRHTLGKGIQYTKLKNSYIIFICLNDYFGHGLAVYERKSHIKDAPAIEYDDGSHVFILNADFIKPNASEEVLQFLQYLKATYAGEKVDISKSSYLQQVQKAIQEVKQDAGKEKGYMSFELKMQDAFENGHAKGKQELELSVIQHMLSAGLEIENISDLTGISIDRIKEILPERT